MNHIESMYAYLPPIKVQPQCFNPKSVHIEHAIPLLPMSYGKDLHNCGT